MLDKIKKIWDQIAFWLVLIFGGSILLAGCGGCCYCMYEANQPPEGAALTTMTEKRESFQLDGKNCGVYYVCQYWTINGQKTERQPDRDNCPERFVKCEDDNTTKVEVNKGKFGWQ
jgi:hypothetical protein